MNRLTVHHFLYPVLIMAGLALAVVAVRGMISNARAEERSIAHADKEKDLQAQRDAVATQAKTAVAALEIERAKPATIQTVTKFVSVPMPNGSELKMVTPAAQPCPSGNCVDAQPFLQLQGDAQKNLQWIQDMEIKHQECDTNLSACAADKILAASQLKEMTADRDNWKYTASGGSKWTRFVKGLKVVGCAGGAVAGGSACQIFF
jgi:hypothetical protein